ncbi:GyrI-like domain-containing protein [Paenibacillus macerans]|uniref:AraC family transcriptional regulator n=1 Tax=Paenibacillus macerans TaxID=44252 RepID=UPI00203D31DA|nr:AraC family transcriptional regulator [Paenibacillus macerans]MCM3699353.1 AraC family transcriptional regulator [Paenibacillus macerans]
MSDYLDRIESVKAYMLQNLGEKLSLEQLAEVSHFSKYHFSRVFAAATGLTPIAYMNRLRLNQALAYLLETDKTVLEISALCGFESASNFNAAFRKHFAKTPSEVRRERQKDRNFSLSFRNNQEAEPAASLYDSNRNRNFLRRVWQMNVIMKELPDFEVAYVRHVGSYLETYKAWAQLGEWAGQNGLFPPEHSFIGISLDDPAATEEFACRYDACVTVPDKLNREDAPPEVQFRTLPGGLYAMFYFYDTLDKFAILYQSIFGGWLPSSEYDPDDRDCLEFSMNNPADDPEGKAKVELYVPVKRRTSF